MWTYSTFQVFDDNWLREAYLGARLSFPEFIISEHLSFGNTNLILDVLFVRHI